MAPATVRHRDVSVAVDRTAVAVVPAEVALRVDGASARRMSALVGDLHLGVTGLGLLGKGKQSGGCDGDDGN